MAPVVVKISYLEQNCRDRCGVQSTTQPPPRHSGAYQYAGYATSGAFHKAPDVASAAAPRVWHTRAALSLIVGGDDLKNIKNLYICK